MIRDLLPRRVLRADSRLRRTERRFRADSLLPFSARLALRLETLLRDELDCLFFARTTSEKANVTKTNRINVNRRDLGEWLLKFMPAFYLSWLISRFPITKELTVAIFNPATLRWEISLKGGLWGH